MLKESASHAAVNAATTASEVAQENATNRIKLDIVRGLHGFFSLLHNVGDAQWLIKFLG